MEGGKAKSMEGTKGTEGKTGEKFGESVFFTASFLKQMEFVLKE